MVTASDATTITEVIVGFFVILTLVVFARWLITREGSARVRRFRVGVFVERDADHDQEPPR